MFINPFVISLVLLFALVVIGVCVAQYVMIAISMYSIAKNKEVKHAWLSWLPVGSSWILGRICDEYDEENNKRKHWALTLIIIEAIVVLSSCFAYELHLGEIQNFIYGLGNGYVSVSFLYAAVFSVLLPSILGNALGFLKYIAKYKVFESVAPEKALKYIVISLLVPLGEGICFLRTKHYAEEALQHDEENSEYDKIYEEFERENQSENEMKEENLEILENSGEVEENQE